MPCRIEMEEVNLVHLCDHKEHLPLVAKWIYEEFWKDKVGVEVQDLERRLGEAVNRNEIPMSILVLDGRSPVGTVNLIENDDENREHLRPWLAALYVTPENRTKGIGKKLVFECLRLAKLKGESEIFLGTDNPDFYLKLGATIYEKTNSEIVIMRFNL